MKKWIFVLLTLLVLISGCLNSQASNAGTQTDTGKLTLQGVTFYTDPSIALGAAKVQGKPVFVYARSESCGWCKKFEEETFTNESVIKTLNGNFILVSIDVYKQNNESRNFRVHGTPTEIFLDSNGTEIKRIPGYTDTETFLNTINKIAT
ncbi:MAG: thioredoxin fold domain-containing protein [Candidatus Methanoperedens sp.]|nr:thioredoxin fold domain-containing protein [Candidatus Methanoperedens sp.]